MEVPSIETPAPQAPPATAKPKRKREARLKPLIENENRQANSAPQETALEAAQEAARDALQNEARDAPQAEPQYAKPKAARERKPRKKKFVANKFDKAIAKLVVKGERDSGKIMEALKVDEAEFENEVDRLCGEGILVRGKYDAGYLSFTVKGFDAFAALFKKTLDAEKAEEAGNLVLDARQTLLKTEEEQKEKTREAEKEKAREKDAIQRALSEDRALLSASLSEEKKEIDLEDAFKKGAPNCGAQQNSKQPKNACPPQTQKQKTGEAKKELELELPVDASAKTPAEFKKALETEIAKAEKGAAMRVGENEVCELCRAPFKIAVGNAAGGGHPKFGHCFCGAAYHKDCFETLATESGGKCVRCGKKLKIALDARSEEAVKELKTVF